MTSPSVVGLFEKPARAAPMSPVQTLALWAPDAQSRVDPRQVSLGFADNLLACGLSGADARVDILLSHRGPVDSGGMVILGAAVLRMTMMCEVCGHGADLAGTRLGRFRGVGRYLAIVVAPGTVHVGVPTTVRPDMYPGCPDNFRDRCDWAVRQIPPGRTVTSLELLAAIGAGLSYARVLPRWLRDASERGAPADRVVTAGRTPGSWAPHAIVTDGGSYSLTRSLWVSHSPQATVS